MSLMNYRSLKSILLEILLVIFVLGGCASQPSYHHQPQEVRPVQPVAVPEPVPEPVMAQLASISNIEVTEKEDIIRVVINGTEPLTYNVTQMEFPLRLVIDVTGARLDAPAGVIPVDKGVITEINPSELEIDGETTARIEVGLNTYMAHYEFVPSGNDLFIDFLRPELMKEAEHVIDLAVNEVGDYIQVDILADGTIDDFNSFELSNPTRLVLDFPGLKALLPVKGRESSSSLLKQVRCGEHAEYFRVVLDCPGPELPPSQVVSTTKGVSVFLGSGFEEKKEAVMAKASSPPVVEEQESPESTEGEESALESQEEASPLVMAKAEEGEKGGGFVESSAGEPVAEESSEVASSAEPIQPPEEVSEPSVAMAAEEAAEEQETEEENVVAESFEIAQPVAAAEEEEGPLYTRAHISLDFKDADIRNILRLIAEVSNLNIVAGDDVQGSVTIRVTDVPWDQALDVILLSNNLGKTIEGNILRIAPIERLTRERQAVISAREAERKLEPLKKGLIPVSYATVDELKNVVINSKVLSPRGSIETDQRTNTMIVIDIEENIREVRRIIDQLDTPTPQVLIEAKVVQINPTYTKELGVTWEGGYNTTSGDDALIGIGGSGGVDIDLGEGTVTTSGSIIDLAPAVGPGAGGAISWGYLDPTFGIFQKIAALEQENKVEIISSPRIMTLDNEEAIIEQGVDIPFPSLSEEGTTETDFKKATLSLKVIPHITADRSIVMDIEVKKDQPSAARYALEAPGIDSRRATTKVLVRNGHTVVIGGVYEETSTDIHNSVPFLGRVPLVSFFFKSTTTQRGKTELIVFITPTIVTIPKKKLEMEIASTPLS